MKGTVRFTKQGKGKNAGFEGNCSFNCIISSNNCKRTLVKVTPKMKKNLNKMYILRVREFDYFILTHVIVEDMFDLATQKILKL